MADVTVVLLIVSLMAVTLMSMVGRQRRASESLARQRAAYRLAESVMTRLHAGQGYAGEAEGMHSRVKPAGGAAPAGFEWVTVTITADDRATDDGGGRNPGKSLASLTGLVPRREGAAVTRPEGRTP